MLIKHFFTYDELVRRRKVVWASRVFRVWPSVTPHLVKNEDIWFLASEAWSPSQWVPFCILPDVHYWCRLSLNGITQIFPEIFLILWFTFLLKPFVTSSILRQKLDVSGTISPTFHPCSPQESPVAQWLEHPYLIADGFFPSSHLKMKNIFHVKKEGLSNFLLLHNYALKGQCHGWACVLIRITFERFLEQSAILNFARG